jgi:pimeloyl-ACP methyl ester carboxylesterase
MPDKPPALIGELIGIGGYRLRLRRMGTGTPVVLDAGLAGSALLWEAALPLIAADAQAITFDRAGVGWSEAAPGDQPRTIERGIEELRALLRAAGIQPPYCLVGHSLGGVHIQYFAYRYPAEVLGLVLVDSSHPEQFTRLGIGSARQLRWSLKLLASLARGGLLRRFGLSMNRTQYAGWEALPPAAWEAFQYFSARPEFYDSALREAEALETSCAQVLAARRPLGALPLVVLTASYWASGVPLPMKRRWLALQRELAAQSPRSTHTVVAGTTHPSLPLAGRGAVVSAVQEVLRLADE